MEELGAGEVVGGMVDVCSETREPSRVPFEPERINAILGTDLTKEEMLGYLARVELAYDEKTNEIVAPTFRQDIHCTRTLPRKWQDSTDMTKSPPPFPTARRDHRQASVQTEDRAGGKGYRGILRIFRGNDLLLRKPQGV